jgi:hypothetical protein
MEARDTTISRSHDATHPDHMCFEATPSPRMPQIFQMVQLGIWHVLERSSLCCPLESPQLALVRVPVLILRTSREIFP